MFSPPPPPPLSHASVFPHLFFPIAFCSSPLLKFWHCSLCLNKEDDKNLKPVPIWKGTLCQIPLPLSAWVKRQRSIAVQTLPAHCWSSPCAVGMESPVSYSTTGNSLRFVGAQKHSPAIPNAMPALSFCLLSCFSVAEPGTVGLTQGMWATVRLQELMHTESTFPAACSHCMPALWPSAEVVCPALLNV